MVKTKRKTNDLHMLNIRQSIITYTSLGVYTVCQLIFNRNIYLTQESTHQLKYSIIKT
jgi:hypothetical protein